MNSFHRINGVPCWYTNILLGNWGIYRRNFDDRTLQRKLFSGKIFRQEKEYHLSNMVDKNYKKLEKDIVMESWRQ